MEAPQAIRYTYPVYSVKRVPSPEIRLSIKMKVKANTRPPIVWKKTIAGVGVSFKLLLNTQQKAQLTAAIKAIIRPMSVLFSS